VLLVAFFLVEIFYVSRRIPASHGAPQAGETAPDFTLPDSKGNNVTLSSLLNSSFSADDQTTTGVTLGKTAAVVLIFYRGYWWPFCNSELRSFEKRLPDFNARKIRVIAISVDTPQESQHLRETEGYTFVILSDAKDEVIRRWDLVHPHGGVDGADIARPAEFLIDASGKVRWVNLTEDVRVRARPEQVLQAFDASTVSGPATSVEQ
jgi:peroxiredoxin